MADIGGKTVLVTGAAQGLGQAIVTELHGAGCNVICADTNVDRAETVAASLGEGACALKLDVSDADDIVRVWEAAEKLGPVDFLVNNAGTDTTLPLDELSIEQIDRVLGVNLRGPFLMCREAFLRWGAAEDHAIVNVCSTASKRAWANAAAYHASKWGLLGLTEAIGVEGRARNIRVTALVVGGMKTPFILDRFPDTDPDVLQDPANVARAVRQVLEFGEGSLIPEVMVIPMRETSWP
ncbi:MAG: SDR family oxidoreductase [Coriobacteriia bacterium]